MSGYVEGQSVTIEYRWAEDQYDRLPALAAELVERRVDLQLGFGSKMNSAHVRRVIAAGMIGNALEWYDFAIYGYFAAQIGRQFFPHHDAVAQLLSAFGVGLSVGGEYTSSMVFLVEHAPEGRRGLMGAVAASGAAIGTLLGSAVGAAFAASMSTATLDAWGWRIPFLLGLVVGIAGYIFRRHVLETGVAESACSLR